MIGYPFSLRYAVQTVHRDLCLPGPSTRAYVRDIVMQQAVIPWRKIISGDLLSIDQGPSQKQARARASSVNGKSCEGVESYCVGAYNYFWF